MKKLAKGRFARPNSGWKGTKGFQCRSLFKTFTINGGGALDVRVIFHILCEVSGATPKACSRAIWAAVNYKGITASQQASWKPRKL